MNEPIGIALIFIGVIFDLLGGIGLARLPDVYNRLQAATKTVTLGTCLILIGVAVASGSTPIQIKAILALALVLVASPHRRPCPGPGGLLLGGQALGEERDRPLWQGFGSPPRGDGSEGGGR
jgi:multicomponent Na+:H+ antiporter subunit G